MDGSKTLWKSFDSVRRGLAFRLMLAMGLPKHFLDAWAFHVTHLQRTFKVAGSFGPFTRAENGFAQGHSFSMIAVNSIGSTWCRYMTRIIPSSLPAVFIDDKTIVTHTCKALKKAIVHTVRFDASFGSTTNWKKTHAFAPTTRGRKILKRAKVFGRPMKCAITSKHLGQQFNATRIPCKEVPTSATKRDIIRALRIRRSRLPIMGKTELRNMTVITMVSSVCTTSLPARTPLRVLRADTAAAVELGDSRTMKAPELLWAMAKDP